jgi:hypothetical protein
MKNEIFDFKRFGAFAIRSWSLHGKKYLLNVAIYTGLMLVVVAAVCGFEGVGLKYSDLHDVTPLLSIISFAYFLSFPVAVMKPLKSRHLLVMENTVPASGTEKWLFVVLNTTVGAGVMWIGMMAVAVLVGMTISGTGAFVDYFHSGDMNVLGQMWMLLLSTSAMVMFAGTMERRNHTASLLLVAAAGVAAAMVFVVFPQVLSYNLDMAVQYGPMFTFGHGIAASEFSQVRYSGASLENGELISRIGGHGMAIAQTLVFWTAAWFNFRERSIK